MSYQFDYLVFIGRFQPFHNGHEHVIREGLKIAKSVIVLVGSSDQPRTLRNPFTYNEREQMIDLTLDEIRVKIHPVADFPYNEQKWLTAVRAAILSAANHNNYRVWNHGFNDFKIGLIGFNKDNTSYYLNRFPEMESVNIPPLLDAKSNIINSTDVRQQLFTNQYVSAISDQTNKIIEDVIDQEPSFQQLLEESAFINTYKQNVAKYPRIEHTVDAVVTQSGHVLLVRRRSQPGKGKIALPGGFVHVNETLEQAMLRELREETKIKVPEPVLRGNIKNSKCYDNPHRSDRGRLITQAFHIDLPPGPLPKVKGSDDAVKAMWIELNEVDSCQMFEDHYHIIDDLVGGLY